MSPEGESEAMWDLGFEVVEEARANRHGRSQMRREERTRSDLPVTVFDGGATVASGWCLDRSPQGARVILSSTDGYRVGRSVTMDIGDETFVFRVVWAYVQDDTCVLGLERGIFESGEYPCGAFEAIDDTLASRAA